MSHLIARILLSMMVFPLAGLLYFVAFVFFIEVVFTWSSGEEAFVLTGLVTWAFVAAYWFLLWQSSVVWTARRISQTALATVLAVFAAAVLGVVTGLAEEELGAFVASIAAPILWLAAAVWLWRETPLERSRRVGGSLTAAILCPQCGYNLAGLKQVRCPECGWEGTLSDLWSIQPHQQTAELESR